MMKSKKAIDAMVATINIEITSTDGTTSRVDVDIQGDKNLVINGLLEAFALVVKTGKVCPFTVIDSIMDKLERTETNGNGNH